MNNPMNNLGVASDAEVTSRAFVWIFRELFEYERRYEFVKEESSQQNAYLLAELEKSKTSVQSTAMNLLFRAVAGVPCPAEVSEAGLRHITDMIEGNPCLVDLIEQVKAMKDGIAGEEAELQRAHELADNRRERINELEQAIQDLDKVIIETQESVELWKAECSRTSGGDATPESSEQNVRIQRLMREVEREKQYSAHMVGEFNDMRCKYGELQVKFVELEATWHKLQQRHDALRISATFLGDESSAELEAKADDKQRIRELEIEVKTLRELLPEGSAFETFVVEAIADGAVNKAKKEAEEKP